jgi:hypothetical protein
MPPEGKRIGDGAQRSQRVLEVLEAWDSSPRARTARRASGVILDRCGPGMIGGGPISAVGLWAPR